MNDPFFACNVCKDYIEAGYRWAHFTLEKTCTVTLGSVVNIQDVLEQEKYWAIGSDDSYEWLRALLPKIKMFLHNHKEHEIIYAEEEFFIDFSHQRQFDWMNVEDTLARPSPRYFAEILKLTKWSEVENWLVSNDELAWYGYDIAMRDYVRYRFDHLVANGAANA